jgi:hypothetical protein
LSIANITIPSFLYFFNKIKQTICRLAFSDKVAPQADSVAQNKNPACIHAGLFMTFMASALKH